MKNSYFLACILTCISFSAIAQTDQQKVIQKMKDSLTLVALSDYATRYPILRQGFFATDILGSRSVTGQLNGKDLYEGKMNITRIRSLFNIPVTQWGKNALTATVSYQQTHFETDDIKSYNAQFPATDRSVNKTTVGLTVSYSRSDSIFNHPISYSGSVSGLTDGFSSVKKVNYLGTVTVPIKRTAYSALSVGLVVIVDPSALAPVIPVVSYWRKFKGSDLDLYVDLPQRVVLRKQLSKKSWAFVGSELGGSISFFNLNQPGLPQNDIFSSVDIRTGATFEYQATKKLVLGVNGGLYTMTSARLFDHTDKPSDYFFRINNGSVPYISFSVSFLPFLKSLK
jgi:hypothetical protein